MPAEKYQNYLRQKRKEEDIRLSENATTVKGQAGEMYIDKANIN